MFKDEQVPTHSVVELVLQSAKENVENTYVRTLRSLKGMFDDEMHKRTKEATPKEKADHIKEAKEKLKSKMDEQLLKHEGKFQKARAATDFDE